MAFSVVCPLKLFSADVAGIGLRRLDVGFHVSSEVALPAFVTHVLLKLYNRHIRYVWVNSSIYLYSCFEI